MPSNTHSVSFVLSTALCVFILRLFALGIYCLLFHPLVKFPGPKIAAISTYYEGYYELIHKGGGKFYQEIDRIHRTYGPIVRVALDELHIKDSKFFDEFFMKNPKMKKYAWDVKLGDGNNTFTSIDSAIHRPRRIALSPMFSRKAVLKFECVIREKVEILCKRVDEFQASCKPVNVTHAFSAFTGDIIMEYFFGFTYKHLKSPEFKSFHEAYLGFASAGQIATQFGWFLPVMNSIPHSVVEKFKPLVATLLRLKEDQSDLVARTIRGESTNESPRHTIMDEILQSDLPPEDKTQQRLTDEAQFIVAAGVETTSYLLDVRTFHIVNTPRIYERLHTELAAAFPDRTVIPDLMLLERLPYLKACVQESFRLSYGFSARNPRITDKFIQYNEMDIPAGTALSMTIVDVHHDESIFQDSHSYIPERWLNNPKTGDGSSLTKYLVSFGRGPRSCLGVNCVNLDFI